MKARIALLSVMGVLLLAYGVAAQMPRPVPGSQRDAFAELVFPPELVMRHQNAIGLQPEQKDYIRKEVLSVQTRFTELAWQLQDAAETMRLLLEQPRADEEQVLSQLEKVLDTEHQIKRLQIILVLRIKNNLTPEQQAQLQELRRRDAPAAPGPRPRPREDF